MGSQVAVGERRKLGSILERPAMIKHDCPAAKRQRRSYSLSQLDKLIAVQVVSDFGNNDKVVGAVWELAGQRGAANNYPGLTAQPSFSFLQSSRGCIYG